MINKPDSIDLLALDRKLAIDYLPIASGSKQLKLIPSPQKLTLLGNELALDNWQKLLLKWLRIQAKQFLPNLLTQLSHETQLPFNNITIRSQNTRWGSCSEHGNISLNDKLLFLPIELVKHILIHELCHTQHLDHSKNFWNLLKSIDKNTNKNKQAIKSAHKYLPKWVE